MAATVLNRFEQTPGPLGGDDNKLVLEGSVESAGGANLKEVLIYARIPDIVDLDTSVFAPGFAGRITRITASVQNGTTGVETIDVLIDGVAVTGGQIVLSTVGSFTAVTVTPTALNTFSASQVIAVNNNGVSTLAGPAGVIIAVIPD